MLDTTRDPLAGSVDHGLSLRPAGESTLTAGKKTISPRSRRVLVGIKMILRLVTAAWERRMYMVFFQTYKDLGVVANDFERVNSQWLRRKSLCSFVGTGKIHQE